LSKKANDEEGQVLAHSALGRIYKELGNKANAVQHLNAALELSKKLGDRQTAKGITEDLARLK